MSHMVLGEKELHLYMAMVITYPNHPSLPQSPVAAVLFAVPLAAAAVPLAPAGVQLAAVAVPLAAAAAVAAVQLAAAVVPLAAAGSRHGQCDPQQSYPVLLQP